MTPEQINSAIEKKGHSQLFEIKFKTRNAMKGLFIRTADYQELSKKNFWRIVSESAVTEYRKTEDPGLAKIFNGMEFTKVNVPAQDHANPIV